LYQLWIGTTGPGSSDLYQSGWTANTSVTVSSLPSNGVKIYARLYSRISGVWQPEDYTYTEQGTAPTPASLTSPAPGSTLTSSTNVQFQWNAVAGVPLYQLWIGTTGPGSSDLYQSGWTANTSVTVPSLPSNGVIIYARLYSRISGVWQPEDFTYTEQGTPPAPASLTSPAPGSTLTSSTSVQFQWNAVAGVPLYQLWIGSTFPGSNDLYESGWTANTSATVPSLPSNGVKIYARLYSRISGVWQSEDFTYIEQGTPPTPASLTSPAPGSTLTSSTNVQFQWNAVAGIPLYQLWLGTTGPGSSNLYQSGYTANTSVIVPSLPNNGVTIYARLYSRISGVWQGVDFTYTAQ
jgi:hypothetical protein